MRNRFEPPMPTSEAQLRSRPFLLLLVRAGKGDAYDTIPDPRDDSYWVDQEGPGLLDRGAEIRYKGEGALGSLWYFWDRLIGWQATGVDAARYGPFAVDGNHPTPNNGPAAGWSTPFVDVDVVTPPVDPPASSPTLQVLVDTVAALAVKVDTQTTQIAGLQSQVSALLAEATAIGAQLQRGFSTRYFGTITPIH